MSGRSVQMRPPSRVARSLRALAWFWLALVVILVGAAFSLHAPGLAGRPGPDRSALTHSTAVSPVTADAAGLIRPPPVAASLPAPHPASAAIAPPDPALEEPAPDYPGALLPRVGPAGQVPMQVYAAIAAPRDLRPRIAILLTGLGMSAAEDDEASVILPAAVSFGVSPYGYHPEATGQMLRARGHESLMSLPMEPQGFPIDDSGPEALLTGNTDPVNRQRMEWAMSRDAGYVGITSSMGTLRGERFASSDTQMSPLRHEIAVRGLLYIDARPGAVVIPGMAERGVDVILDAAAVRTEIDAKLALLEEIARARGSAIGLAGPPHPVIVARIDAWASTLKARGFVLVPVSALASLNGTIVEGGTSP